MRKADPRLLKPHPLARLIPDMRDSEWQDFYADVAMRGIKVPLEVLADGTVVDGRHRLRAAIELGMREVPVVDAPLNGDSPEAYMLKAAVLRRHLTDDQRACMAALWIEEHKQERGEDGKFLPAPSALRGADEHPTRSEAVALFKVSRKKVDRAGYVKSRAADLGEKVFRGETKLNAAYHTVHSQEESKRIASMPLPAGQYAVIVIDPPWPYQRGDDPTHRAANPYPSMSLEQLRQLPIPAADNCILWLWTTNAFLHEAFHLLEAWGFQYKTMLTWVKEHMGLGDWLRGKTEHCLLAIKGSYRISPGNATTVLIAANKSHSTKPEEFYALVERLCPGNRLEMFARRRRDGWEAWGSDEGVCQNQS